MVISTNFPDKMVAEFSEFGWPSGCISLFIPKGYPKGNYASILAQKDFFTRWVKKTADNGTLAGPFAANPLCTDVSVVATGAVPKNSPGDFRIIHNFSFPAEDCLNLTVPRHTYLGECFVLTLGKLDEVAQEVLGLKSHGHNVKIWGRDLIMLPIGHGMPQLLAVPVLPGPRW
jgi:hypothetical protein